LPGGGISTKWLAGWVFWEVYFGLLESICKKMGERNAPLYEFEYFKNEYIMLLCNSSEIIFLLNIVVTLLCFGP